MTELIPRLIELVVLKDAGACAVETVVPVWNESVNDEIVVDPEPPQASQLSANNEHCDMVLSTSRPSVSATIPRMDENVFIANFELADCVQKNQNKQLNSCTLLMSTESRLHRIRIVWWWCVFLVTCRDGIILTKKTKCKKDFYITTTLSKGKLALSKVFLNFESIFTFVSGNLISVGN